MSANPTGTGAILHREGQIKQIEKAAKLGKNVLCYGPPGTGKTFAVKQILSESKTGSIYVNCWEYNTRSAFLSKILTALKIVVPRKGIPIDVMLEKLQFAFKKVGKLMIVLDELDHSPDKSIMLYDLIRVNDAVKTKISILAISNSREILNSLDQGVSSRFIPVTVEFPPYSPEELFDILKQKSPEVGNDLLVLVAREAGKTGDFRLAEEMLERVKNYAAEEGKFDVRHALKVLEEMKI